MRNRNVRYKLSNNVENMTMQEAIEKVRAHNEMIDNYINNELAKKLGAKNGKISLDMWFKAQELISEQDFNGKAQELLQELWNAGYDVKINMQNHKLVF